MFIRCCIILHNLIIRLEGRNFDVVFREHLYEAGRGYLAPMVPDMSDDEDYLMYVGIDFNRGLNAIWSPDDQTWHLVDT